MQEKGKANTRTQTSTTKLSQLLCIPIKTKKKIFYEMKKKTTKKTKQKLLPYNKKKNKKIYRKKLNVQVKKYKKRKKYKNICIVIAIKISEKKGQMDFAIMLTHISTHT